MNNVFGSRHVAQIGIVVKDIENTAKTWADLFDLPLPETRITDTVDQTNAEYKGNPTFARAKMVIFKFDNIDIELIEPVDSPSAWNDQLIEYGDSMHHIAFRIKGMQEKIDYLIEKEINLVQKGEHKTGRYSYLDSVKKLGLILELLEND